MSHKTFVVANGDNLDIIKNWIQEELDECKGSTFKSIKVLIIDSKDEENIYEFTNDTW